MSKQDQFKYRQISEFRSSKLSRAETAKLLRISERSVSRLAARVSKYGISGVFHGNRGLRAVNRVDARLKRRTMELVRKRYYDLNMLHCLELLKSRHRIVIGRETFRKWCQERELVKRKKRRRSRPRHYRSRMPAAGYLLQMDGSPHRYNGRDVWSLIVAIDDATSEIPYGEFFHAETTAGCMQVLKQIILIKGVPRALYVDKAGWAGGGKRVEFSQFHRACEELGIQVIFANSPEGKGRVERAFNTIQDRLIPELRLRKIRQMAQANEYLNKVFLKKYWNQRNVVKAEQSVSDYRSSPSLDVLNEILCYKSTRAVDRGQCISLHGDTYQVSHPTGMNLFRKRIQLRRYADQSIGMYLENTKLKCRRIKKYQKPQKTFEEEIEELETWLEIPKSKRYNRTRSLGN